MAGVPTEMTFNTTSTVMTSQCATIIRFRSRVIRVGRQIEPCMSYRSKTYSWNDVILLKRSMIRGFSCLALSEGELQTQVVAISFFYVLEIIANVKFVSEVLSVTEIMLHL